MDKLRIDPEFRDKIPPLTDAEFEQLRENILNDGEVYEPIAVWNGTIVDGHNGGGVDRRADRDNGRINNAKNQRIYAGSEGRARL